MIIARNIPYKATDRAETIMDGKMFPNMIPHDVPGSLGVVKNIEFKIVAYLPRFFILIFVKFYVFVYRILL